MVLVYYFDALDLNCFRLGFKSWFGHRWACWYHRHLRTCTIYIYNSTGTRNAYSSLSCDFT